MAELGILERLARQFAMGGWAMYPLTLVGATLVPGMMVAVIVAAVARRSRTVTLLVALALIAGGLLVVAIGGLGWWSGSTDVERALVAVHPIEDAEMIRALGTSELLTRMVWALFLAIGPVSLGVALSGLGLARLYATPKAATAGREGR